MVEFARVEEECSESLKFSLKLRPLEWMGAKRGTSGLAVACAPMVGSMPFSCTFNESGISI